MQVWSPHLEKDKKITEKSRLALLNSFPILQDLPYERRLKRLNLTTLEIRQRGISSKLANISMYRIMNHIDINLDSMFQKAAYTRIRGHQQKFAQTRSRLNIRKQFCCQRVEEPWSKLPGESQTQSEFFLFLFFHIGVPHNLCPHSSTSNKNCQNCPLKPIHTSNHYDGWRCGAR